MNALDLLRWFNDCKQGNLRATWFDHFGNEYKWVEDRTKRVMHKYYRFIKNRVSYDVYSKYVIECKIQPVTVQATKDKFPEEWRLA